MLAASQLFCDARKRHKSGKPTGRCISATGHLAPLDSLAAGFLLAAHGPYRPVASARSPSTLGRQRIPAHAGNGAVGPSRLTARTSGRSAGRFTARSRTGSSCIWTPNHVPKDPAPKGTMRRLTSPRNTRGGEHGRVHASTTVGYVVSSAAFATNAFS